MMMEQIERLVKTGFYSVEDILEMIIEEEDDSSIEEEELRTAISRVYTSHEEAAKEWEHPTDFERLVKVFDMICDGGIIAMHHAGMTISDGMSDVRECYDECTERGKLPAGYCFYHEQDIERAIDSHILPITFGTFRDNPEHSIKVAEVIVSFFEGFGFNVYWDGDMDSRIELRDFLWTKTHNEHDDYGLERAINLIVKSDYDLTFNAPRPTDVVVDTSIPAYTKHTFAEIEHLLPVDSWMYGQRQRFKDELVLVYDDDLTLDQLDLDHPLGVNDGNRRANYLTWLEQQTIYCILIKGNLTVHQYIYNENTDGSTGLFVLGDVQAGNMIVGGQEIYIQGKLDLEDLFWGDYNHGRLTVCGNVTVPLFVETDDYDVDIRGQLDCKLHWRSDADTDDEIVEERCLFVDGDGQLILDREGMLAQLRAKQPLLKARALDAPPPPQIFEDNELSVSNVERMLASPLIKGDDAYELYIDDVNISMNRPHLDDNGKVVGGSIYMVQDDTYAVFIYVHEYRKWFKRHKLTSIVYQHNEDEEWHTLEVTSPSLYLQLLNHYWPELLEEITYRELLTADTIAYWQDQFRERVTVEEIERILALPMVTEEYNDFDDSDKQGYWHGDLYYKFRIPEGEVTPRIGICKGRKNISLFPTVEDDYDIFAYLFDIETSSSGSKQVVLRFEAHNARSNRLVEPIEIKHIQTALRWWSVLQRTVYLDNDEYLDYLDNVKYWEEQS
ncbi:DUF6891 domain-containing protein [Lysinibacillus sp. NPDC059133]|uniref:DUF6891 domain-containing protein n=1 Tax=Lysinibacillus sp. NPDC059133 TaxID=3346737 RepID=UPI0036B131A3